MGMGHSWLALLAVAQMMLPGCPEARSVSDADRVAERTRMVERQLAARDIRDPLVLAAMQKVPRHRFVPDAYASLAYQDHPLPIGHEQTISQPYTVASMTQAIGLRGGETVLEIGTGSGYQAAVLAEIAGTVYTIEILEPLARRARATLAELGYTNIRTRTGDGYFGWPEAGPFDAIVVTAAPDHIPPPLLDQLAIGGCLVIPVGTYPQTLVLVRRTEEGYERTDVAPVVFVPLQRAPTPDAAPAEPAP